MFPVLCPNARIRHFLEGVTLQCGHTIPTLKPIQMALFPGTLIVDPGQSFPEILYLSDADNTRVPTTTLIIKHTHGMYLSR